MSDYYVLRIRECDVCFGSGRYEEGAYRRNAVGYEGGTAAERALLKENASACLACLGTGKIREEVGLEEALAEIEQKRREGR